MYKKFFLVLGFFKPLNIHDVLFLSKFSLSFIPSSLQQVLTYLYPIMKAPQTPQKSGGFHSVPTGILTPPITPDKDYCDQAAYGAGQSLLPRIAVPCTPTPPPSAEHQQQLHFASQQYEQYVQPPQFV